MEFNKYLKHCRIWEEYLNHKKTSTIILYIKWLFWNDIWRKISCYLTINWILSYVNENQRDQLKWLLNILEFYKADRDRLLKEIERIKKTTN